MLYHWLTVAVSWTNVPQQHSESLHAFHSASDIVYSNPPVHRVLPVPSQPLSIGLLKRPSRPEKTPSQQRAQTLLGRDGNSTPLAMGCTSIGEYLTEWVVTSEAESTSGGISVGCGDQAVPPRANGRGRGSEDTEQRGVLVEMWGEDTASCADSIDLKFDCRKMPQRVSSRADERMSS